MSHPLWSTCPRNVRILDSSVSDLEFVRSLKEPCLLSNGFTSKFQFNLFLKDELNEFGMRPVDYEKFLKYFGEKFVLLICINLNGDIF